MRKFGLLPRILVAIVLGLLLGHFLPLGCVRVFATFNGLFSQFLGFMIPLIIAGLVTPAIGEVGRGAGKLLLATVAVAYLDTLLAGLLAYGSGSVLFPDMVETAQADVAVVEAQAVEPYFKVNIPPLFDVMSALILSFVLGLGIAYGESGLSGSKTSRSMNMLQGIAREFRIVIAKAIQTTIIPLLPLYIFGIFLQMVFSGEAYRIVLVFAQIIVVIFILHIIILLYEFLIAGGLTHRNPLRLLWTMLPAYMTALGTSSSAATIPVTLRQAIKNGVSEDIASFTVPLCATIHLSGSAMKITACALTICILEGLPSDPGTFVYFIMMLGIIMVAAPGVPGGAVMAALAPLDYILGFNSDQQALMIALYIAMDSFGTACNVTGDGAISIVIDKFFRKP